MCRNEKLKRQNEKRLKALCIVHDSISVRICVHPWLKTRFYGFQKSNPLQPSPSQSNPLKDPSPPGGHSKLFKVNRSHSKDFQKKKDSKFFMTIETQINRKAVKRPRACGFCQPPSVYVQLCQPVSSTPPPGGRRCPNLVNLLKSSKMMNAVSLSLSIIYSAIRIGLPFKDFREFLYKLRGSGVYLVKP